MLLTGRKFASTNQKQYSDLGRGYVILRRHFVGKQGVASRTLVLVFSQVPTALPFLTLAGNKKFVNFPIDICSSSDCVTSVHRAWKGTYSHQVSNLFLFGVRFLYPQWFGTWKKIEQNKQKSTLFKKSTCIWCSLSSHGLFNCGRQEEPAILISRLLLRMRRMYVASIRFYFH